MRDGPTALGSWGLALVSALELRGVDAQELLLEVGLTLPELADPRRRHPIEVTTQLWRRAVAVTGDPAFGIEVARHASYASFHALGFSLATSATLLDALERIVRFFALVTDAAEISLEFADDQVRLVGHLAAGAEPADEAIDALMAVLVRLCRVLKGRHFKPLAVELRRSPPHDPARFMRYFRAPIRFRAPLDVLVLDRAEAGLPLLSANPELARANDAVAAAQIAQLRSARLTLRVRGAIRAELAHGPLSLAAVARRVAVSPRSLQRKLAQEGTSFGELLDETRRELATNYLSEGRHSVMEVTYLLGFADVSTFSRAFKRWTGTNPAAYARTKHRT